MRAYVGPGYKSWMGKDKCLPDTTSALAFVSSSISPHERVKILVSPFGSMGTGDPLLQYRTVDVEAD